MKIFGFTFATVLLVSFGRSGFAQHLDDVRADLIRMEDNYHRLATMYPGLRVRKVMRSKDFGHGDERAIDWQPEFVWTSQWQTYEGRCRKIIKVLEGRLNARMRAHYIWVSTVQDSVRGKQVVDYIVYELERGESFEELHRTYSIEGLSSYGIQDWFDERSVVADFSRPIREQPTGSYFGAYVEPYGWYVIYKLEDIQERVEYDMIEVSTLECPVE